MFKVKIKQGIGLINPQGISFVSYDELKNYSIEELIQIFKEASFEKEKELIVRVLVEKGFNKDNLIFL